MVVFNVFYLFWTYKVKILQNILSGSLQQFPVLACPILQRKQLPGTCWLGLRQSRNSNKWNTLVALHNAKESHARRTHFHPAQPKRGALCSCRHPLSLLLGTVHSLSNWGGLGSQGEELWWKGSQQNKKNVLLQDTKEKPPENLIFYGRIF